MFSGSLLDIHRGHFIGVLLTKRQVKESHVIKTCACVKYAPTIPRVKLLSPTNYIELVAQGSTCRAHPGGRPTGQGSTVLCHIGL